MASKDEIIALEKQYFQSMVDQDGATAAKLTATDAVIGGPQGVMTVQAAKMANMMDSDAPQMTRFELSDINVIFPADNVAVIGYKIKQDMRFKGEDKSFEFVDTSTWINGSDGWTCAQHSETPVSDETANKD